MSTTLPGSGASSRPGLAPEAPAHPGAQLRVEDLVVRIPTSRGVVHPVNRVSFTVDSGEVVGIIGETGSGKTTVARALTGILPGAAYVESGTAQLVADRRTIDLVGLSRRELRRIRGAVVGFVPQSTTGALNPVLTIGRQFASTLRAHRRLGSKQCHEIAVRVLHSVGIAEAERVLSGYAHQLSGGMAQRVVMAMCLALDPSLIIADEPTTGLDVTVQRRLLDELTSLVTEQHRSLLLITHDLGVVSQYCHRVIVLYGGYVLESGLVDDVFDRPAHPYTRSIIDAIPRKGHQLKPLPGAVGDLLTLPAGCPFHARCPVRSDPRCESELPPLLELGGDHRVATFCEDPR